MLCVCGYSQIFMGIMLFRELARVMAPKLAKEQKLADDEAARVASEKKQSTEYAACLAKHQQDLKLLVGECHTLCSVDSRAQSAANPEVAEDCKCAFCPIWWSTVDLYCKERGESFKPWQTCGTTEACHWCLAKLKQKRHTKVCPECLAKAGPAPVAPDVVA